ncbi:MAG: Rid family detoxifying hydrolase [Candidatus Thermoplasmatota archaeon]|nr:Rid family detoxifying hydrolase [Candidatus Thermoplasmatota archaeon]
MTALHGKWIRETVSTEEAPAAIGPYNQAVAAGPLVFVSGTLGIVPGTKEFAGSGVREQAIQAIENLANVLDAAGSSFEQVLKTTIYLSDMNDFPEVNGIYAGYLKDEHPARATVEVSRLPMGALIEIDAVALRD